MVDGLVGESLDAPGDKQTGLPYAIPSSGCWRATPTSRVRVRRSVSRKRARIPRVGIVRTGKMGIPFLSGDAEVVSWLCDLDWALL